MKITPNSLRAARALLSLNQSDLGNGAGIPRTKIVQFEKRYIDKSTGRQYNFSKDHLEKIELYFQARGIRFTESGGAEPIPEYELRTLRGRSGFRGLMDEIYTHARDYGGRIEILNGLPDLFIKHLSMEWYTKHADRMFRIKENIQFRIIIHENQETLIAGNFAEYRRIPKEHFNNQTIYIFSNNVAVFSFSDNDVTINMFKAEGLAQTLRMAFDLIWETAR